MYPICADYSLEFQIGIGTYWQKSVFVHKFEWMVLIAVC